jgi:prophage antirepressor-like protein
MRSHLPAAGEFEEWVVGTVLPSIRKNGGYIAGQEQVATGEMSHDELMARALKVADLTILEAEQARLQQRGGFGLCDRIRFPAARIA